MSNLGRIIGGTAAIILVLILLSLINFDFAGSHRHTNLPAGATSVVQLGNGWVEFKLHEQHFLYHRSQQGITGYESITAIDHQ
jgi:hypothetical protein